MEDFGLPKEKLFYSLAEVKKIGLMSTERAKILIYAGKLKAIKNGIKWLVPRGELIRYLNEDMAA